MTQVQSDTSARRETSIAQLAMALKFRQLVMTRDPITPQLCLDAADQLIDAYLQARALAGEPTPLRELLHEECSKRGLLDSLPMLLRHIRNNNLATLGAVRDQVKTLRSHFARLYDTLDRVSDPTLSEAEIAAAQQDAAALLAELQPVREFHRRDAEKEQAQVMAASAAEAEGVEEGG